MNIEKCLCFSGLLHGFQLIEKKNHEKNILRQNNTCLADVSSVSPSSEQSAPT